MAKHAFCIVVIALAMCCINANALRAYSGPTSARVVRPLPSLTLKNVRETIRDVKQIGNYLDILGNSNPMATNVLLILLSAACQKLKDQGVNPLPDYCYVPYGKYAPRPNVKRVYARAK